jgi:EAL domain-containing protein (putative c-di-GMP-specific phosphodiesterase class I)/CHASE2 domain-containing sensor protein
MKRSLRRWSRDLAIVTAAAFATLAAMAFGVDKFLEHAIEPIRFAMLRHEASGRVAVVEMDAASAAAIRRWPWPREHYAAVVEQLRRAGAANIVFDVDVSSSSTPEGDRAFARTLAQSDGLVALPTFAQRARSGELRSIDSLPLPMFRRHTALASVSIAPDDDGIVRQAPFGTITAGVPRPSLSAYISGVAGSADTFFPIDYAIRPASIPRLSFVAVRDGAFDPAQVRGRSVLIGATAIEMGDRYATPGWGVIPGVIVQALAADTLVAGVPTSGWPLTGLSMAAIFAIGLMRCRRMKSLIAYASTGVVVAFASGLAAQAWAHRSYPLAPALMLIGLVSIASIFRLTIHRLREQRLVDEETGLPNRRAMVADLDPKVPKCIAVASLANLDSVTAVLGQKPVRDVVLRIADRARLTADEADIYRLGDRLLGFVLPASDDRAGMLEGLRAILLQPVEAGGRKIDVAVSIGLSALVGTGIEASLTKAILAAETAQAKGWFWAEDNADFDDLEQSISLMGELDEAINAGDIEVHYQPKLALANNRIVSVEALVRWPHLTRGQIRPDRFIPLAEQTGRIAPLTLYVLARTIQDLRAWQERGHDITAAVNISASLVGSSAFTNDVIDLLRFSNVATTSLVFEVTESAALENAQEAVTALERFRDLGIAISMDDYGTGQSTLSYLRTLPLAELKIDRSFVEHAHLNRNDAVMVRSTIELAHDLGLKVVAEGIEEPACLEFLRSVGCDLAQGYLISRPIPAEQLSLLLDAEAAIAARPRHVDPAQTAHGPQRSRA